MLAGGAMDRNFWALWGQSSHIALNSLHRSSAARKMVLPAQRTLSTMIMRASPGPGCPGNGATSRLSPAP